MVTRNVVLTNRQNKLVTTLVSEGRYQNASEVLRDSLRLLEEKIERQNAELANIRSGVLEGLGQADRGEFESGTVEEIFESAFDEAKQRMAT